MRCQEDPATPAYVSKEQAQMRTIVNRVSRISVLLQANEENKDGILVGRNGQCAASENPSFSSSESSSIGIGQESPSGSRDGGDGGGEGEEVQSEFKEGLGSMESLENSRPLKRGLSNFYAGKSKSFTTISDAITINDLAKPENPFNKRRRVLMARKTQWAKKAFSAPLNRKMALLPFVSLEELKEEEEESMGPTIALFLCKKENSRAL